MVLCLAQLLGALFAGIDQLYYYANQPRMIRVYQRANDLWWQLISEAPEGGWVFSDLLLRLSELSISVN